MKNLNSLFKQNRVNILLCALFILVAAVACGGPAPTTAPAPAAQQVQPTAPAPVQPPAVQPSQFKEAPTLAALVKENKLPPVDQRLPKNPLAIKPVEKVGKYGGTWRTALLGGADTAWLVRTIDNEHLVRWDPEWKKVIPNVAESFEANKDATEFTFKLRQGLKWSDGKPYTADDILFWYEDVAANKELNPGGLPSWMKSGGKDGSVEKVDQFTVKFKFPAPNGLFLQRLATPDGSGPTSFPKEYLKQFHSKYNKDNLQALITEAKAENWVKLFQLKGSSVPGVAGSDARWQNKDLPTLHGWMITTPYGAGTRVVAERNPYYFKVDSEGNQLPYIDRVVYDVMQDREVLVLKAVNGEIDFQDRHIATNSNKAVFTDNQQKGQYRFFETVPSSMNDLIIALNLTHKNPEMRKIFQNKDFRIGLSYAINRKEIIDLIYVGQGQPYQAGPRPTSPFYNEKLAKQYTEFDVAKANEYLDKVLPKKDAEGFRLGADGKRFTFVVEVTGATGTERVDGMKLIQGYWKKVGIDMQVKEEDRTLLYNRKDANEHDAVVWGGDGGLDVILEPRWYFPYSTESNYAEAWVTWWNPGGNPRTAPEEPPAATKKQIELYKELTATGDEAKQTALMKEILDIAADQFYIIGISLSPNGYGIVKNSMSNVPKTMPGAWLFPNPAPVNPSQFFFATSQ
jgi:peptide/nickel transport system substrate-binding protein